MPSPNQRADFWNLTEAEALAAAGASTSGLASSEAESRLRSYGPNDVEAGRRQPLALQLLTKFANPLVLILLLASALSGITGDIASFLIVVTIVVLSVLLDFVQEVRAGNAAESLRRSVAVRSTVLRDNKEGEVVVDRLVPGDIVRLGAGDLVPADCRLIAAKDFFVNQALLTGEPYPVEKTAAEPTTQVAEPAEASNAAFMGTAVISGSATALVVRTGRAATLGRLAGALARKPPPSAFEIGIRRFGGLIMQFTVFLVLFVLLVNVVFHRPWLESLTFALALAVGLTPELLPMIITVTLSRGAVRLARKRVIVKRLAVMHNIGAIDVLCTDKTGTLTEAKIRLVRTVDCGGRDSDRVFEFAYLNSHFETGIKGPLDQAILDRRPVDTSGWHKLDEVPFDFERRRISVLLQGTDDNLLVVKGAPETILQLSVRHCIESGEARPMDDAARAAILERFAAFGRDGYRAVAVAYRTVPRDRSTMIGADERDLVFAGFAVFVDPPKDTARDAIAALARAGIRLKIVTGDNELVTRHVCNELDIAVDGVLLGEDLLKLSDEALLGRLEDTTIFARVNPQQKRRILMALKRAGHTVGFLGDGINDASALHAADVGISVDTAADVAKDAAELILLEHDLSVVHEAVIEGRRTVANVTKYILMGSSSNFGNMFSMAGAALLLPFLPMLPIQVLLNNLLYDFSEAALPFDRVDEEDLARPAHWDIAAIRRYMLVLGPISSLFDFLTFFVLLHLIEADKALFQTGWFVESLATQVLVVFAIRSRHRLLKSWPHPVLLVTSLAVVTAGIVLPFTPLASLFGLVALPPAYFAFLAAAVALYLIMVDFAKRYFYRMATGGTAAPTARPSL